MGVNRKIIHVLVLISVLFLSLIMYLTYFEVFTKDKIVSNSYNQRLRESESKVLRGSIFDRSGQLLAKSEVTNGKQVRNYPYGPLYSQIIGYNSRTYGKSLIEASYNDYLLGKSEFNTVFDIKDKLTGTQKSGNNLNLTIDHSLQLLASKLLGDRKGAVVAINPRTGEILAMVSKPDYNPNDQALTENWVKLVESQDYPFLPRATQGLYTPGSTYKVVIGAAAIENGMAQRKFQDDGSVVIDGRKFTNFGGEVNGNIDLKAAFALSSNVAFSQVGVDLGEDKLRDISERMGVGKKIDFDIPLNESVFPYKKMSKTDMAAVGIGQGKMLVSPLHMALIAASVANDGVMMKPYLVGSVVTNMGISIKNQKSTPLYRVMSQNTAAILKDLMREVVEKGTGTNASIKGIQVAGKTGTAENELTGKEKNKEHAWFIGFAPANDPQIAVAVILEYSGSTGGQIAAPIARDIMSNWIGRRH
jgi:penicillin-binding protein A